MMYYMKIFKIKQGLYYQYLAKQEQFPFEVVVIIKLPYGGRADGIDIELQERYLKVYQ